MNFRLVSLHTPFTAVARALRKLLVTKRFHKNKGDRYGLWDMGCCQHEDTIVLDDIHMVEDSQEKGVQTGKGI